MKLPPIVPNISERSVNLYQIHLAMSRLSMNNHKPLKHIFRKQQNRYNKKQTYAISII